MGDRRFQLVQGEAGCQAGLHFEWATDSDSPDNNEKELIRAIERAWLALEQAPDSEEILR